ncbi:DUF819 domain-containing protein [Petroclostridium xylanilyticum]|jgi:uncharacterized membrane protein|uniref:DUF819 family protein n=1 Tax=Petroclostridium xylanilyticum TaxID=1792311 RepID=UPI000B99B1F5|nr:DUF819 family protein [Petroclostridium xylanilyticum]
MEPMLNSTISLLAVMFMTISIGLYLSKHKPFTSFGPAIIVIVIGIILSNFKIVPTWADVYGVMFEYAIPLSIAIMLLGVDLSGMLKLSKQPLLAMFFAVVSVSIAALVGGIFMAGQIPEGWKVAGMFVGTYTGGSSNLTAIGTALQASPETFAAANAADYVVGIPSLVLLMSAPAFMKNSKWFNKVWPYKLTDEELELEGGHDFMQAKEWSINDIAWLLGIGFAIVFASTALAQLFPADLTSVMKIILITTISIIVAQFKVVRNLRGKMDLGLYVALFFLVIIGFMVDIRQFFSSTITISIYCTIVILGSLALHLLLCRLAKIKYQYVGISIMASIADGTTAALMAASGKWESLISIAVVLGIIGNAVGNYVGITIGYLIKGIIGM